MVVADVGCRWSVKLSLHQMCNQKNGVALVNKRTLLSDIYFIKGKMAVALQPLSVLVDKWSTSVLYKVCVDCR